MNVTRYDINPGDACDGEYEFCDFDVQPSPDGDWVLWSEVEALVSENARLRAIVEKLPKTRDGISVVPHIDTVWYWQACTKWPVRMTWWDLLGGVWHVQELTTYKLALVPVSCCYSTREAAEAAKEKDNG